MTVGYKAHPRDLHQPRDARPGGAAGARRQRAGVSERAVPAAWRTAGASPSRRAAATCEFYIAYEFKSQMLQMLVGGLFDRVFRRYTQAFEERARAVYGADAPRRRASAHRALAADRAACQQERQGRPRRT